jgi:hypothetical protein
MNWVEAPVDPTASRDTSLGKGIDRKRQVSILAEDPCLPCRNSGL